MEHVFLDAGGLRMHVAQAGRGEPILMLHGWPQHWYLWRRMMPLLASRARVLCPDLRGFGWTDVPGHGYDRETMAGDVLALLDELGLSSRGKLGLGRLIRDAADPRRPAPARPTPSTPQLARSAVEKLDVSLVGLQVEAHEVCSRAGGRHVQ